MTSMADRGVQLTFFNTETREKEPLVPLEGNTVRMYTCGPTVYDYAHIGNFRTFVFEDFLRRTIQFFGMKLNQVMNITDIDDKTIRGAIQKNSTLKQFVEPFIQGFFEDLTTLHVEKVEHYPRATEYIPKMIEMVEKLLQEKVAYVGADGSVYFAIARFPKYGRLSQLNLDELQQGARVQHDEYSKESASDFVLWKKYDPTRDGQVYWESPFGKGRPGWHLECSVMANALLGSTIDLHVGGVDLIFPHHENEIAQSEACTKKQFARMWLHVEHLLVDGKKMSKSLGNFYTLRDVLQRGFSGQVIRMLLLSTHYRTQLNFTMQGLEAAKASLQRINDFITRLETHTGSHDTSYDLDYSLQEMRGFFKAALADDLNVSEALAVIFELIRQVNHLCDQGFISSEEARKICDEMKKMDAVFGVMSFAHVAVPEEVEKLAKERLHARKNRDWKLSDELRQVILQKGYVVEDVPEGYRLKKN